jgi:hypothetical protein
MEVHKHAYNKYMIKAYSYLKTILDRIISIKEEN